MSKNSVQKSEMKSEMKSSFQQSLENRLLGKFFHYFWRIPTSCNLKEQDRKRHFRTLFHPTFKSFGFLDDYRKILENCNRRLLSVQKIQVPNEFQSGEESTILKYLITFRVQDDDPNEWFTVRHTTEITIRLEQIVEIKETTPHGFFHFV